MNPGFFMPVCLLLAKVRKIFQIADDYARFLRKHENNEREAKTDFRRSWLPARFLIVRINEPVPTILPYQYE
jgi:hypothetical protein